MRERVSLIIPAHNEEERITKTLESYWQFFKEKKDNEKIKNFEILVVINNTSDRTEEIVKKFSKKYPEIRYLNLKEKGKGFAIIRGFKDALTRTNTLIGFIDADMSTPPNSFYRLITEIKNNDGIIANRWDKKSIFRYSFLKKLRSRGYNYFVRTLFLFQHQDTQCGAKLFKREILEKNIDKIVSSQWNFDVALLFCLKKESHAKIISIPTIWEEKGGSKILSMNTPSRMFISAIRLRLIHSPFNFIVRFYRKLPERLKIDKKLE